MEASEPTKDCPKCEGRGKHADVNKTLVQVTCDQCDGSGKVPESSDAQADSPAKPPRKVPFQGRGGQAP